ncbi:carbamoyltransferase HypF [Pseudolysobacter antarcticus]|uniref:Carbamoyltransferase HypF n=1 Tax=Pseudolysobacter antarcticus TaxID=2511995 RepID=A0A411HNQ4_9GAMM|nr:carbamoyltransferase HypF [Pseudolysobacter antarcticus]QBB72115.1 carbamoyltransferase HypF [Pseudolysobacter antarcticus]
MSAVVLHNDATHAIARSSALLANEHAWPEPRDATATQIGCRLHVRGIVQGVGFRPGTLKLAREFAVVGSVRNEGTAVIIDAFGTPENLRAFESAIANMQRGGARVDALDRENLPPPSSLPSEFSIAASATAQPGMGIAPDWATCPACAAESLDPFTRRYRYPFTACTDCGPRLSVFERTPYDRANTTLAGFPLCAECATEYADVADRRFHAQAIACHACGPRVQLRRLDGRAFALDALSCLDDTDATTSLIDKGQIVLIKGLGGYQLACDARNNDAVARLRQTKRRDAKPFALLARDLAMVRLYCDVDATAEAALGSAAAPIVLLPRRTDAPPLAAAIAPGLNTLGVMLPNTPLHHLLMRRRRAPIVLTSGNLSAEPQAIDIEQVHARLAHCADYVLDHNRPIARRIDDSLGRVIGGKFRIMRRARGYAPAPMQLPPGFDPRPQVLALGGDLKNCFALLRDGQGVLSQHIGDLHDAACRADYERALADYLDYYHFTPELVACDLHPGYAATQFAEQHYADRIRRVGHHHAHIAACLGEHAWPRDGAKVLGIALDGIGLGDDGSLCGGEFLHCDYVDCTRIGTFKPVALLGADLAAHEPWRNTYAQIMAEMGWSRFAENYDELDLFSFLESKPRELLDAMLKNGVQAPLASSTGRLFDAVAAAIGICREHVAYEGEAAMRMESLISAEDLAEEKVLDYPFAIPRLDRGRGLPYIEPLGMWQALLGDLVLATPPARMAARFHRGLAVVIVRMAMQLAEKYAIDTVALSGGVFQNRVLTELVLAGLEKSGLRALLPAQLPVNDGGLAWGQALVALARNH